MKAWRSSRNLPPASLNTKITYSWFGSPSQRTCQSVGGSSRVILTFVGLLLGPDGDRRTQAASATSATIPANTAYSRGRRRGRGSRRADRDAAVSGSTDERSGVTAAGGRAPTSTVEGSAGFMAG